MMNTELKHTNILESAASLVPVLPFNHKNATLLNCEVAFFTPPP